MKEPSPPDKKRFVQRFAAYYLIALFFFGWGFSVSHYKVFPWQYLSSVVDETYDFLTFTDGPPKKVVDRIVLDHQESLSNFDFTGFRVRDPNFTDNGYLLISEYKKDYRQSVVQLFSISEQKVIHTWVPPLSEIFGLSPGQKGRVNTKMAFRSQHPFLFPNGDLLFTSGEGPLVRINACGRVVWVIDRHFHHSIERDYQSNFLVPILVNRRLLESGCGIQNTGFAVVSPEGRILKEYSVPDILFKNGYRWLMHGIGGPQCDCVHLNDAQPILAPSETAEVGDVALSMRNLSTVALFRPATGKIVWLKTGPWIAQHDITPTEGGCFSIFGNDIPRCGPENGPEEHSDLYIYNPLKDKVFKPFSEVMKKEKVVSPGSGRFKILANGDAFVEESDRSRILRISRENVRWEYVNSVTPETVGGIYWSRYIPSDEINLEWKEHLSCPNN
jgi:hypothetical protein